MINFQLFPRSKGIDEELQSLINVFKDVANTISQNEHLVSNDMLALVRPGLEDLGFKVEKGKGKEDKIPVPVLFGENNEIDKSFYADAQSADGRIVLEVEAGRAVFNNQFLKDIFQACMMHEVKILVIAVLNEYHFNVKGKEHVSYDFQTVKTFLETMFISNRLHLPLEGILLIGY